MHRLDRAAVEVPNCLKKYRPGQHDWDNDVSKDDRQEVRVLLLKMTSERCAYCERFLWPTANVNLPEDRQWHKVCHIEHFRRRKLFPELTFEWSNLFLSCNDQQTCGKHKDESKEVKARPFDPARLIKPDDEDPGRLLFFTDSGEVRPRRGLRPEDDHHAMETIRVFNLNHPRLVERRRAAARVYRDTNFDFFELLHSFPEDETGEILRDQLARTADDEFATTIKHLLLPDAEAGHPSSSL